MDLKHTGLSTIQLRLVTVEKYKTLSSWLKQMELHLLNVVIVQT